MIKHSRTSTKFSQAGTTLLVALVILAVMSVIGISAANSAILQQKMSANFRSAAQARNAAELALRTAERWLTSNVRESTHLELFDGNNNHYAATVRPDGSVAELDSRLNLTDADDWENIGIEVSGLSGNVAVQSPKYIIEYIGRGRVTASATQIVQLNAGSESGDVSPYFFRITAIGWSGNEKIYSVLQTTYRTGYGDNEFIY